MVSLRLERTNGYHHFLQQNHCFYEIPCSPFLYCFLPLISLLYRCFPLVLSCRIRSHLLPLSITHHLNSKHIFLMYRLMATSVFCHSCGGGTTRHMHSQNTQYAGVSSKRALRLVKEAVDCLENERLTHNVGTTAVMVAPSQLVDGLV